MESGFQCAGCGEWNTTTVDDSAGRVQSYIEDCQVCCKPNLLRVEYDSAQQEFVITAELE
jgi:cysteine-rich CPXCG protein